VPELTTPRFFLRPLMLDEGRALHEGAETLPGWVFAGGYPLPDTRDGVGFLVRHGVEEFGFYLIVRREDGLVVGEIGFVGPPVNGVVTIGYAIVPSARGHGYATEAIRGLTGWALARADVDEVHADTLPDNEPSVRALLRAGFAEVAPRGRLRRFVLSEG
jgi:RimJ/RimL family protein N-acetyltransferase